MEFSFAKSLLVVGLVLLLHKGDVQAQTLSVLAQNVAEDAAVGTTIETLAGSGGTGPYTAELVGTSDDFEITGLDLKVKTGSSLDHETKETNNLLIKVADNAGATATVTFVVTVTDVDETPRFAEPVGYVRQLTEGATAGTTVTTITATDEDEGAAGAITSYDFHSGNTDSTFAASATGVITVAATKTANAFPYVLVYEARGTTTGTTTILLITPIGGGSATNSIGIMALVTSLMFQAVKYL